MAIDTVTALEWVGSVLGVIGAILMARNSAMSPLAYPLWTLSSFALVLFALMTHHAGLLLKESAFTAINLVGVWRWVIRPRYAARYTQRVILIRRWWRPRRYAR